jgi:hypothetical protein
VTWQEGVGIAIVCLGLFAGAYVVSQRPSFWLEFGTRLLAKLLPLIWRVVSKRMPPEEEAEYRRAVLAGRGDEWLRNRMRKRLR